MKSKYFVIFWPIVLFEYDVKFLLLNNSAEKVKKNLMKLNFLTYLTFILFSLTSHITFDVFHSHFLTLKNKALHA